MPPDCDTRRKIVLGGGRLRDIKDRNVSGQMLNSSPHHTANMKLLLFKLVVCCAAVLAAPADKQKRDILPGDPRYGTEHHHEHEHHENENEVQISRAAGGYVGSYTVPDDTQDHSFQVQPQQTYGLPNHVPGKPLGNYFIASGDTDKTPASVNLIVPSTSYGIPDFTQLFNTNFATIDDKKPAVAKDELKFDTINLQKTVPDVHQDVHHVEQPAVIQKHHVENIPQTVSLPQVKVTASHVPTQGVIQHSVPSFNSLNSYSSYSSIPVKTLDRTVQVQVPQPYQVPVTKHIAVPVPVPHTVEIPKPYYVRVPQPVQVTVDRPYPVEVPRPVPYPVPQYVKTNVPVAYHHHVTLDTKANPFQTFFDNTHSTFQNVLGGVPTFSGPLEGFSNPFENFDLSSFPGLSFIPSSISSNIPFLPQPAPPPAPANVNLLSSGTNDDSIAIDNAALKTDTTVTKPAFAHRPVVSQVVQPVAKPHTTNTAYKPSTACAGCTVTSASSKQEYVQPTDANGGYVY